MKKADYKYGVLVYNNVLDRLDIEYSCDDCYGGLHCGQGVEIKLSRQWVKTTIEMNLGGEWYFTGIPVKATTLLGVEVRKNLNKR